MYADILREWWLCVYWVCFSLFVASLSSFLSTGPSFCCALNAVTPWSAGWGSTARTAPEVGTAVRRLRQGGSHGGLKAGVEAKVALDAEEGVGSCSGVVRRPVLEHCVSNVLEEAAEGAIVSDGLPVTAAGASAAAVEPAAPRSMGYGLWTGVHNAARCAAEVHDRGAHAGGAEALAHGAARCRKRCSNTVPTLAELKHLHTVPRAAARGGRTRGPRWRS